MNRSLLEFNGTVFELEICKILTKAFPDALVIHNKALYCAYLQEETQIDVIFIHQKLVAVIEAKNWKKWVSGNYNEEFWYGRSLNPNTMKVRNIFNQNFLHIRTLRNALRCKGYNPEVFENVICFPDGTDVESDCKEICNVSNLILFLKSKILKSTDSIDCEKLYKLIQSIN